MLPFTNSIANSSLFQFEAKRVSPRRLSPIPLKLPYTGYHYNMYSANIWQYNKLYIHTLNWRGLPLIQIMIENWCFDSLNWPSCLLQSPSYNQKNNKSDFFLSLFQMFVFALTLSALTGVLTATSTTTPSTTVKPTNESIIIEEQSLNCDQFKIHAINNTLNIPYTVTCCLGIIFAFYFITVGRFKLRNNCIYACWNIWIAVF